jgi:signal transduction histidine kinase
MIYLEINLHKSILTKKIENTNKQLTVVYDNSIKKIQKYYADRLKEMLKDETLIEAFYNQDRELLYTKASKMYRMLKVENINLSVLHFITKDNISFLRFHRKHKFGDSIEEYRKILKDTNVKKTQLSGFEIGLYGLYYRVTSPMYYKGKHIGSVEFGIKARHIMRELNAYLPNHDSVLLLDTQKLQVIKRKSQYIDFNGCSKMSSCEEDFFDSFLKNLDINKDYTMIQKDNKEYIIHSNLDLLDYKDNKIGKILVATDITKDKAKYQQNIYKIIVGALVIYIMIMMIINYAFRFLFTELERLNNSLEMRVQEEIAKQKSKEKLLIQQSKLATMGEMLSMIAHQWRQPLTAVNAIIQAIELKAKLGKLDNEYLSKQVEISKNVILQMSQTIDDFRNFFKPNKEKEYIFLKDIVSRCLVIVNPTIINNSIDISIDIDKEQKLHIYSNELLQVLLNIINNATDALVENKIESPKIEINSYHKNKNLYLDIIDNGGGIDSSIIDNIFDPYFSTKSKNGTGLGLYMSNIIVQEHFEGNLLVDSSEGKTKFTIILSTTDK